MEEETFNRLFELSHKREDNLVIPLILEYYTLERYGLDEDRIIKTMEKKYN